MARKRKKVKDSTKYWDSVLRRAGLSMDAGRDPGHRKLLYVGNSFNLEAIYEMTIGETDGRVRPAGHAPDA